MTDSTTLIGLSQIINKDKTNLKLDLESIERDLAGTPIEEEPIEDNISQDLSSDDLPELGSITVNDEIAVPKSVIKPILSDQPTYKDTLRVYADDQYDSLPKREKLEERKEKMLADIEELQGELEEDGVDLSRIPEVNEDSSYENVGRIYKLLKRKYNRSRCEDLGQGIILAGARMLEVMFNGKKEYFGYRPDMRGWHMTVRSKLHRMRYEQAVIVAEMLEKYNIGPIARLGLELIPSAFIYSFTRREQHGQDNYHPNINRSEALNDLRDYN